MIDISNLDKAEVLAGLYNYAQPQGFGFLHFKPDPMTVDDAREIIEGQGAGEGPDYPVRFSNRLYFDYFHGRVMKVDLSEDKLDPFLYNRSNGEGAAERVITAIRAGVEPPLLEADRVVQSLIETTDLVVKH